MKPLFAIPTTCGTGSEISPAAVITDPDSHYKHLMLNCTPNVAILDPNLVAKMPAPITAATGMDALTHAIEAYVNPGNTPFTRMFATRAIQQISANLRTAVNGPDRPDGAEEHAVRRRHRRPVDGGGPRAGARAVARRQRPPRDAARRRERDPAVAGAGLPQGVLADQLRRSRR